MNPSSIKHIISSCILLLALYSANSAAIKLYKWVDTEGKISYQDRPPPVGQSFEEKSFTDQGAQSGSNPEIARSRAILENPITLYVADNCGSCDMVRTVLDMNDVPYEQIAVDTDTVKQKQLVELAGSVRVPTLTIGDDVLKELDRNQIEDALRESGYIGIQNNVQ